MNNVELDEKFMELVKKLEETNPKSNLAKVEAAWEFAKLAHHGQKRLSGEDFVSHPLEVAKILTDWKLDINSVTAGILHDTCEDGGATKDDLEKQFGRQVSLLVEGVSKVSYLKLRGSKEEEFVENLRKMFLAMAADLRVILIKLADRLHNMRTLSYLPEIKQKRISQETLEIYAPLADRLGMGEIKAELEDLAFPYVYRKEYEKVLSESKIHYKKIEEIIDRMKKSTLKALAEEGIKAKIQARKKHLYSLWKKLERPEIGWDFDKIHDIIAIRVIVNTVSECYSSLGIIHKVYKPVPYIGISDFIAQAKPNGYQSIHTKVFGPNSKIVEIQLRTFVMHEQAEFGIAAHWAYAEAKTKGIKEKILEEGLQGIAKDKLTWVRQLVEWQNEIKDTKEFYEAVKFDALKERNFVFSPNGDVYDLPKGATPIDFAYAVHTDLANYIKSAKVNGKIVPLDYKLKSGDIVEIIKTKNSKVPSRDWLDFVVTATARREVGKHLRKSG
jgi:guanosine-3',5'-bis(diphosphate) 3'-pyrophosphohydrolase